LFSDSSQKYWQEKRLAIAKCFQTNILVEYHLVVAKRFGPKILVGKTINDH
jgi:hypothetical protein